MHSDVVDWTGFYVKEKHFSMPSEYFNTDKWEDLCPENHK